MGYFILITVLILFSYYVWALFFNKPKRGGIELEVKDEESIQYTFDKPIEVSEELILRQEEAPIEEEIGTPPEEDTNEPIEDATTSSSSGDRLSNLVNLERAKEFSEKVFGFFNDVNTPSSMFSGEVEYIAFAPLDLSQALLDGHSKFAHIKIA